MSENSPAKQRAFHPYGRTKVSPFKAVQVVPTHQKILSTMNFSFSGGSASLFPTARPVMSEVTNLQKQSAECFSKNTLASQLHPKTFSKTSEQTVGVIGSRRPLPVLTGKPNISGFIPLDKSFKIWGDTSSSSIERSEPDENKPTSELQRTTAVTQKLNVLGEVVNNVELENPRGILTERKTAIYDFPEYTTDIYKYWLGHEKRVCVKPRYMEKQRDITHKMRSILIDWLVEVSMEYDMHEETIFLAVNCVDRFLSKMAVTRNKLQLIGSTALFVAAKYEELNPPEINDVVYITDETYTKQQILSMEKIMLHTLGYELMVPTAYDFVRVLCTMLLLNSQTTALATYLTELTLLDGERYLRYFPSVVATAAVALSRYTHEKCFWDERMDHLTPHNLREIQKCAESLFFSFYDAPTSNQGVIYEKYKSVRYCSVAQAILPATLPWIYMVSSPTS